MKYLIFILLFGSTLLKGQCPVLRTCEVSDVSACGEEDGSISFTYTGGVGEPSAEDEDGNTYTGSDLQNLKEGVYFITIEGPGDCDLLFCIKIKGKEIELITFCKVNKV